MAKKPTEGRRKLVEFDAPTWHALNLLSRESMKSFQELTDSSAVRTLHEVLDRPLAFCPRTSAACPREA
jgi:hypothetical protein